MLIETGIDRIQQHTRALRAPLVERAASGAFAIVSPTDTAHDSAIVCVRTDRPQVAFAALRDAKVTCAIREGNIRISPHCYNTIEELERVADTLAR